MKNNFNDRAGSQPATFGYEPDGMYSTIRVVLVYVQYSIILLDYRVVLYTENKRVVQQYLVVLEYQVV